MMQQLSLFEPETVAAATDAPSVGQQRRVIPPPPHEAPCPYEARIGPKPFKRGQRVIGPRGEGIARSVLGTRYPKGGPRSGVLAWQCEVYYLDGKTRYHWPEKLRAV